jgi:hypothetical protein
MFTRDFMHDTLAWWRCSWSGPRLVAWVWSIRDDHSLTTTALTHYKTVPWWIMRNTTAFISLPICMQRLLDCWPDGVSLTPLSNAPHTPDALQTTSYRNPSKNCVSKSHTLSLFGASSTIYHIQHTYSVSIILPKFPLIHMQK